VIISGGQNLGDIKTIDGVKHSFRLAGAEAFHTAEDGCIRVEIAPGKLTTESFRPHVRAALTDANFLQTE
jgi:hypothetical protein